jgi:hypothetical protein
MKRSYLMLIGAAPFFASFALIGWLAKPHIPNTGSWIILKMAAYNVQIGGVGLASLLLVCAGLNWLGSHWEIENEKLEDAPSYLLLGSALAMMTGLVLAVIGGAMTTLATVGLFVIAPIGLVMIPIACLIRGMIREKSAEEVMAEWRRQQGNGE